MLRHFVRRILKVSQACVIFHDTLSSWVSKVGYSPSPCAPHYREYVELYESSVHRPFQSHHFRSSLRYTLTAMPRVGEVDPAVQ